MHRSWIGILMLGFLTQAQALNCYVTVVKDNCWLNYDVKANLYDTALKKRLTSIDIPKGKTWSRVQFTCHPLQPLGLTATYSPEFWKGSEGKVYITKKGITLPRALKADESAWHIPICFSDMFAQVPMPPDTSKACACDFSKVSPVPPS